MKLGRRVKIIGGPLNESTGIIIEESKGCYKIKLDEENEGCKIYISTGYDIIDIKENIRTNHVTISIEKLKELIINNYKWNDYTLQGKIDIVMNLAYFESNKELLEFLIYMEE